MEELETAVSSYVVAQNPEVLARLLRENQDSRPNPSIYTTPASAFNTLAVDLAPPSISGDGGTTSSQVAGCYIYISRVCSHGFLTVYS